MALNPYIRLEPAEINALPQKLYTGPVHIIRTSQYWKEALPDLQAETVLGFDTETKPTFAKGQVNSPALLQLATARAVYLIQLRWFPLQKVCRDLLTLPNKIKAGVAINEDLARLKKIYPFNSAGFVDIAEMAKNCGLPNHGLRTLAATLFGWRISKNAQCSNWNAKNLTSTQIAYAATDAWISRQIYFKLLQPDFHNQAAHQ